MKIVLPRVAFNAFREVAYTVYPKEHLTALIGLVAGGSVEVTNFLEIPHTHPRKDTITYGEDDLNSTKMRAVRQGKRFIGTIHTHPGIDSCSHPSRSDMESGVNDGELLMGILYVWKEGRKFRSSLEFFEPRPPIKVSFRRGR